MSYTQFQATVRRMASPEDPCADCPVKPLCDAMTKDDDQPQQPMFPEVEQIVLADDPATPAVSKAPIQVDPLESALTDLETVSAGLVAKIAVGLFQALLNQRCK